MASARAKKKAAAIAVELPECPVCMETMSKPIYQCQSGHSLCNSCTSVLNPRICPICRQPMSQTRNWQLEDIIAKAKVPCPNKSAGCKYIIAAADVEDHLKECIYREMVCPLRVFSGKCCWSGKLFEMMDHFKERHPTHCASTDSEIELGNVTIYEADRRIYLVNQAKMIFILTVKIDTIQKMAYWTIQHIGTKKAAQQHIYEIIITSNQNDRKNTVFTEHCFNDSVSADEIFRQAKCAILPLDSLKHFIKDKKVIFRFSIKRLPPPQNNKASDSGSHSCDKNPGFDGSKGPGKKFNKPYAK